MKWKNFLRYWPYVRWIDRSPMNSPHKDQWRGALMFSLISAWINVWQKSLMIWDAIALILTLLWCIDTQSLKRNPQQSNLQIRVNSLWYILCTVVFVARGYRICCKLSSITECLSDAIQSDAAQTQLHMIRQALWESGVTINTMNRDDFYVT